ncbi:MAG: peptidoglycan DD-metalloendopeptidase family protein, partial [Rhizobiaceae bacterium]
LRAETAALLADLSELRTLADAERTERDKLASLALSQAEESRRLAMLLDARKTLMLRSEAAIEEERHQQDLLAARATTLKDLLDNIDALVEARARARDAANLPAPGTLLSATPFSAMTGRLALPVAGRLARRFGEMDGAGAHSLGDTVQTQSGAIVTAPSDGTVLFSGPFRSYGQLLIVDAGGGYHVVLAGMANLSVSPGQSVLAGEPVGRMGETRLASAAALSGDKQMPVLYVEFRKDGKPVDPAPWWVARHSGRLGNDS